MAQTPDAHFKLILGDLAAQLALARAENEALRAVLTPKQITALQIAAAAGPR